MKDSNSRSNANSETDFAQCKHDNAVNPSMVPSQDIMETHLRVSKQGPPLLTVTLKSHLVELNLA